MLGKTDEAVHVALREGGRRPPRPVASVNGLRSSPSAVVYVHWSILYSVDVVAVPKRRMVFGIHHVSHRDAETGEPPARA